MPSHTESSRTADPSSNGSGDQSAFDWVADTARNNPMLVVGAAVAVGALAALAISQRNSAPVSRARSLEKRLGRELASMERALRRNRPLSRMSDHLADASSALTSRFGSWNTDAIEGLIRRAGEISSDLARRRGL